MQDNFYGKAYVQGAWSIITPGGGWENNLPKTFWIKMTDAYKEHIQNMTFNPIYRFFFSCFTWNVDPETKKSVLIGAD